MGRGWAAVVCLCVLMMGASCSRDTGGSTTSPGDTTPPKGQTVTFEEPDACATFELTFTSVDVCDAVSCPALECDCDLDGLTNPCMEQIGCLSSWSCEQVCGNVTSAFFCIGRATSAEENQCSQGTDCERGACEPLLGLEVCKQELPCRDDAHCGEGGYCVRGFGVPVCTLGGLGDVCSDGEDCGSGFCSSENVCTDGALGSSCKEDTDCASSHCVHAGSSSGVCFSGEAGEPCDDESDCEKGACIPESGVSGPGSCTDGSVGSRCQGDEDCENRRCGLDDESFPVCIDGELGERCDSASDCESGYCGGVCTRGGEGDPCGGVSGCASGYCGEDVCTTGAPGDSCRGDEGCESGQCAFDPNHPSARAGECTDGQEGSVCGEDEDCANGYCVEERPDAASLTEFYCRSGEEGARCWEDADCAQGYCVTIDRVDGVAVLECASGMLGARCDDANDCDEGECQRVGGEDMPRTCAE